MCLLASGRSPCSTGGRLTKGRHQTPEETANAVLFLASEESFMLTGCILNVDGGTSLF